MSISFRSPGLARVTLIVSATSAAPAALAAVPTISSVSVSSPFTPTNTMMYDVSVTVSSAFNDNDHDARVGFAPSGTDCATGTWNFSDWDRFATSTTRSWRLYNFQPGTAYDYKVQVGRTGSNTQCGSLGTPSLPTGLANMNLVFDGAGGHSTPYVIFDTGDCDTLTTRHYLVAVDTATEEIVWYLDVGAAGTSGGSTPSGWRFQEAVGSYPDLFLMTLDRRYLYQWDWEGNVVDTKDYGSACAGGSGATGPCLHHDAWRSPDTGRVYAATARMTTTDETGTDWDAFLACDTHDSYFVDDGYDRFDGAWSTLSDDRTFMTDYGLDPTDPLPATYNATSNQCNTSYWSSYFDSAHGPIDWIHLNSITSSKPGTDELLILSMHNWDQIVRVNATTGAVVWRLNGTDAASSDLTLGKAGGISGTAAFAAQHDAGTIGNDLLLFDNSGEATGSRVLRIALTGGTPPTTATITKSWLVMDADGVDPVPCDSQGSAEIVAGTSDANALAMCTPERVIVESNISDGTEGQPLLHLSLPATGYCTSGGPGTKTGIAGWYRAFGTSEIGEF